MCYPTPEYLDKLETLLVKYNCKYELPYIAKLRKEIGVVKEFDLSTVIKADDSSNVQNAKTQMFDILKSKELTDDEITKLLSQVNDGNFALIKTIIDTPDVSLDKVNVILSKTNEENVSLANRLILDNDVTPEIAQTLLDNTPAYKIPFVEYLLNDENIQRSEVAGYLPNIVDEESAKFVINELCADKNLKTSQVLIYAAAINKDNVDLALKYLEKGYNKIDSCRFNK